MLTSRATKAKLDAIRTSAALRQNPSAKSAGMSGAHTYILQSFALGLLRTARMKDFQKVYLTNRFHVAVRLFSNRSQMTSKCGKNKKVAHEAKPSVSLMFLPHFDVFCHLLLNRRTATWNLFVLYNNKETTTTDKAFFIYKAGLCPLCALEKKPFDVICCLYKMQQSHWLLCVEKTCDWSWKITPLSNLTQKSLLVK